MQYAQCTSIASIRYALFVHRLPTHSLCVAKCAVTKLESRMLHCRHTCMARHGAYFLCKAASGMIGTTLHPHMLKRLALIHR